MMSRYTSLHQIHGVLLICSATTQSVSVLVVRTDLDLHEAMSNEPVSGLYVVGDANKYKRVIQKWINAGFPVLSSEIFVNIDG